MRTKKVGRFLYWTPRMLSILFLMFLAMFSLDVFDSCSSISNCALALFMHNLPVLILLVVLLISWKHEIVGGIVFILAGAAYLLLIVARGVLSSSIPWYIGLSWSLTIAGPAFVIGILFLINWKKRK